MSECEIYEEIKKKIEKKVESGRDSYYRPEGGLTGKQVIYLCEKIGNAYLDNPWDESHNSAPSIREMLELNSKYPDMTFMCYTVWPPRNDYRVSCDGFVVENIDKDTMFKLMNMYHHSDEINHGDDWVSFWWD